MDVTWPLNFFRLRVNADRVLPIPPMTINKPPMIRISHLRSVAWFWLEIVLATVDAVTVKIDIDDEDKFDETAGDNKEDEDDDDDDEVIW